MHRLDVVVVLAFLLVFAGCQTRPGVTFSGQSHADETLKRDTLNFMSPLVRAAGCNAIDHVDTEVLFYEPSTGEAGHVWGREGWMVTGCSRPFPFKVTFTEDGVGGTFMGITRAGR